MFDNFDDSDILDEDVKWTVENENECYNYEITEDDKLRIRKESTCSGRIFLIPKTSKQVKSISAEVTVIASTNCQRPRLLADPVMLRNGGSGFHQLALIAENCDEDPGLARFHIYYTNPDWLQLFDGLFSRNAFFGPGSTNLIIGETYKLYLRVSGNEITSRIMDGSGELLGRIRYTPPGGLKRKGDHVLGLSVFGGVEGTGEFLFDNVRVCFY